MNTFALYSHMPIWVQNILCNIQGYILTKQRYGGEYNEISLFLKDSDDWNQEQILQYKEENASKILWQAYNHTKFYRRFFDDNGVHPTDFKHIEDLKKFPILTKEMVRANWQDMIADNVAKKDLIAYHTSGSTGKALDFYWTKHSLRYYWATVWRDRERLGIKKGDLHINFTGKIVVPLSQSKPPYWRYNKSLNQYMLNMQHITPEKIVDLVNFINNTKAKFFSGYPSIMYSFAMLVEEAGLQIKTPPSYIFPSAEKTYDYQRETIERVFKGAVIIEHYGFSEGAGSATKNIDGVYRETFELGHLEIKENVNTGTLLATGFQNYGMPFIRYEIGDTATFISPGLIKDIEGRNEDYIITPEGAKIMRMDYIFKGSSGIKECQIEQRETDRIIIRVVPRANYNKISTESAIRAEILKNISRRLITEFEYVDFIPRTKAGKFKAIISKLNH